MTVHGDFTGNIRDEMGSFVAQSRERYPGIDPTDDMYRTNMPRRAAVSNASVLTTQVLSTVPIYLFQGDTVTSITFVSATTAASVPTNWWFALYDPDGALVGQTADQTSTAWAANTKMTKALGTPAAITETGWYRAGIMVKATTPPTLAGVALHNAVESAALISGELILSATSDSSLTDTAPATLGALTAIAGVPLCILT
ncbi:hypothetical protein GCM10010112_67840 [Actinoplanes lobatus]|uniref:Uncharacterized protein n=1 Tax=Actinoplanes lobatus TaxID=113568 RepID=A0A7W7HEM1_9ACTN|nr:hypothetical protein [Actinoplanes lobatus]MBB4749136.1 hypothetical protein [Actinoplanes lobatus]GGN86363.1 hypothetical protein GCM10010112_67840 [Actinoplanes lobatus]GIE42766.1 hypothetical protein Alo02nite_56640 [Actinoplanes lobatus]